MEGRARGGESAEEGWGGRSRSGESAEEGWGEKWLVPGGAGELALWRPPLSMDRLDLRALHAEASMVG